jgi:Ni2+-binding GTPase involved in maturation of urease and hydrogenase
MTRKPIPTTILTGFLGAGKPTMLTHILHGNHGLRIAVLVNDFGAVNIDAQLVVGIEGEDTVNLANGCICCTIRDDLLATVCQICARPEPPDYILVYSARLQNDISSGGKLRVASSKLHWQKSPATRNLLLTTRTQNVSL